MPGHVDLGVWKKLDKKVSPYNTEQGQVTTQGEEGESLLRLGQHKASSLLVQYVNDFKYGSNTSQVTGDTRMGERALTIQSYEGIRRDLYKIIQWSSE
ncbi:hypothetical protein E2C01_097463 [Portunus trituberculatus]|uniref:Uncharacterized protein n=1 Tax=Portunus trituberculatus TaxID=210409 RepID=A0A5B7K5S4_PORTR|nr:hypothetical protein [Portunus trituberculatus]